MFITLSKTIGHFGGFRLGVGTRITSKNIWYMGIFIFFIWMFKLMWYALVLTFWMMYAMCYGTFWLCKKLVQLVFKSGKVAKEVIEENQQVNQTYEQIVDSTAEDISEMSAKKFCSNCGSELNEANLFCVKCGNKID